MTLSPLEHTSPPGETPAERKGAFGFYLGVGLIALSFAIYPAWAAIPMLPLSREVMAAMAVGGWVASWTLSLLGFWLAGKEGWTFLKKRIAKLGRR